MNEQPAMLKHFKIENLVYFDNMHIEEKSKHLLQAKNPLQVVASPNPLLMIMKAKDKKYSLADLTDHLDPTLDF